MRRWLPIGLLALFLVLVGVGLPLNIARGTTVSEVLLLPVFSIYAAAGALIVIRASEGIVVGWLLMASAEFAALGLFSQEYATRALIDVPGSLPFGEFAAWVYMWSWFCTITPLVLILFVFPDGRLPSRRWRVPFALVCAVIGVVGISFAFGQPGDTQQRALRNPLFLPALQPLYELVEGAFVIYVASFGLAVTALLVRFRRSRGTERLQLKWSMATATYALVAFALAKLVPDAYSDVFWVSALASIPIGIAIAILRYRLYDIDVVIERTLVYGTLSVSLGAIYVGAVIATQALLGTWTGGNEIAVAASTLLVIALFQPIRRRLQRAVDRRFYRARYDAQRILDAFTAQLRDEVDITALEGELVGVIDRAVRPASVSLWLRPDNRRS